MADLHSDQAQELFRPFGGGLPRKGKGAARKKKPVAAPASTGSDTANTLAQAAEPPPPPPPKLVRPVFVMPPPDSAVWEEVLTEVAPPRPPSVPVKVVFTESRELPHWHEMPLETPGLPVVSPVEPAPADQPQPTLASTPQNFVPKDEADLLADWFQDMERPFLEAAARQATKGLEHHVLLALPVERLGLRTRRLAIVARKVVDEQGRLSGYEYPKAGHEQLMAFLPWTQHMPTDERNDTVRRLEFLGSKLRRVAS